MIWEERMRAEISVVGVLSILLAGFLVLPVIAQEKKTDAEKKAGEPTKAKEGEPAKGKGEGEPAKAKAEKVSGDIGLLDTEKNYMIVVTKEGKLITLDINTKTKVTEMKETKVKMGDVGLGSSANVEYVTKGEKNFLTKMTFVPAKGE
jgi:hypothetical protein